MTMFCTARIKFRYGHDPTDPTRMV